MFDRQRARELASRLAIIRGPVVTAPFEAEPTNAAYLAITPVR
jgi:hypothetical protein